MMLIQIILEIFFLFAYSKYWGVIAPGKCLAKEPRYGLFFGFWRGCWFFSRMRLFISLV